ncbi:hypothetical protein U8527_21185 [Kordia algicida OT-1]|uniref:Uncharacterized protein n=1 Tax=Kordia algicida OT-1 TaxID=391587 RepID=A9DLB0_9FLAO|nr:hypothetical protein [Kordia algicida]EDP98525.1 hypothetical protein KAOT1_14947 [Kordia algicida OT-1]
MKDEVIISQGNRSLWHNILAAFFYAVTISCVVFFFYSLEFSFETEYVKNEVAFIQVAILSASAAFFYSVIQTYYFDFKNNQYKHERAILMFKLGKWKPLPALEYVSVFKKDDDFYQVNVWYVGNKHFKIYQMFDEAEALEVGKKLAKTLQIDLLDATVANNSKWIEL